MREIQRTYERWLQLAVDDPDWINELRAVQESPEEIRDRFYQQLAFGTGGLRGVIGAGGIADRRTIPGMMLCDNAELVAVMEINMELAEKCRAKWGCKKAYDNEAELLAVAKEVMSREELKYCPHGRPICVSLSKKQLEKQFKRS